MAELWLFRHPVSIWNKEGRLQGQCRDEPGLAPEGMKQAERVAIFLRKLKLCGIWTSPLNRTMQFAQIINSYQPTLTVIHPEADLMEWTNGEADGLTINEVKARFPEGWARWEKRIPNDKLFPKGETMEEVECRGKRAVQKIVRYVTKSKLYPHYDGIAIGISHGALLSFTLASLQGISIRHAFDLIPQDNGCVNKLRINGTRVKVKATNITSHLEDLRYTPDLAI